jgi:beta-phosphoglucomutase
MSYMMNERGVIYDLDGVLVDTAKYHYLGWKKLADELGVPFDEIMNEKLKGVSRRDSLLQLLGYTPPEHQITEWCDRKNGYYVDFISRIDRSELLPGALRTLRTIYRAKGWKQALASASKNAKPVLHKLDIDHYFDAIVDGNDFTKTKPDPEVFLTAAQRLQLPPERLVVFEDAEAGVRAAKAAGMIAIGVGDPATLGEADRVVENLAAITLPEIEELFQHTACLS